MTYSLPTAATLCATTNLGAPARAWYHVPMYGFRFAIATVIPAILLICGAFWGGLWLRAALVSVIFAWIALDPLGQDTDQPAPGAETLLILLAVAQLAAMPLGTWALATQFTGVDWFVCFLAFGTFLGQIGNPAAHELIHRAARLPRLLGAAFYTATLFGHHTSAHRLVHHSHVATPLDPNSARRGQGFWRFWPRAWIGSFRAGYAAEQALVARSQGRYRNPYPLYIAGGLACVGAAWVLWGWQGALCFTLLAAHSQSQIVVSDYVQHYGLRRAQTEGGRYEPVGTRHSWNASGWYSSALMLNAARHSDHHAHPARPYDALRVPEDAPRLPAPLPAMALLALIPPLWRRVMDPRVAALTQS